jgi:RNA polymerase sigma-70 factor (ECF subfamily)
MLLDQLLPVERTAFLLHHVFGRSRAETAHMVGVSEATCQRLLRRVQHAMSAAKPTIEAERRERHDVANRFLAAVGEGDLHLLEELLAPDVVAYVDAAQTLTVGRHAVARALARLNGAPAVEPDKISLQIADGFVHTVRWAAA